MVTGILIHLLQGLLNSSSVLLTGVNQHPLGITDLPSIFTIAAPSLKHQQSSSLIFVVRLFRTRRIDPQECCKRGVGLKHGEHLTVGLLRPNGRRHASRVSQTLRRAHSISCL